MIFSFLGHLIKSENKLSPILGFYMSLDNTRSMWKLEHNLIIHGQKTSKNQLFHKFAKFARVYAGYLDICRASGYLLGIWVSAGYLGICWVSGFLLGIWVSAEHLLVVWESAGYLLGTWVSVLYLLGIWLFVWYLLGIILIL